MVVWLRLVQNLTQKVKLSVTFDVTVWDGYAFETFAQQNEEKSQELLQRAPVAGETRPSVSMCQGSRVKNQLNMCMAGKAIVGLASY